MDQKHIENLYDKQYASSYNDKFLFAEIAKSDADFELATLKQLIQPGMRWLDLACGTGHFLSHFPDNERVGVDLSSAMITLAKEVNPGVTFHHQSFLETMPEWENQWDVVSCMWYAYGLVDSIFQVEQLIGNIGRWTSPAGLCFVPLSDPTLVAQVNIPYQVFGPWPGEVHITGILWSYSEEGGKKVHAHQIAPQVEWMKEKFGQYFETIEIVKYPPAMPGWEGVRCALLGRNKRV